MMIIRVDLCKIQFSDVLPVRFGILKVTFTQCALTFFAEKVLRMVLTRVFPSLSDFLGPPY
jgi:hypothetical protein